MGRPYDSPINDFVLPEQQAQILRDRGLHQFDLIVCSPFRRCLQTAAVVARELQISRVRVDKRIGEKGPAIRKCQQDVWGKSRPADGKIEYLAEDVQLDILCHLSDYKVTTIERQDGWVPPPLETYEEATQRNVDALCYLRDTCCFEEGNDVLVVAHGDTVGDAVETFTNETCYNAKECCWIVFDFDGNKKPTALPKVVDKNRIESLVLQ